MNNKNYRVRIVRAELQLEVEGDKKFVLDMLGRFDLGSPLPHTPSPPKIKKEHLLEPQPSEVKSLSAGEFIRQFSFKKHTDYVLAFGFYLEKHSGLTEFSPADINSCYYEAKMESSNTSQMIIQNIKRGYIMAAKHSGKEKKGTRKYTVTNSGEKYLEKALTASADE